MCHYVIGFLTFHLPDFIISFKFESIYLTSKCFFVVVFSALNKIKLLNCIVKICYADKSYISIVKETLENF